MNAKVPWIASCAMLMWNIIALAPGGPREPRDIARQTFPSVVLLSMSDASGRAVSIGSGFFVLPDVVVTSLHVIERTTGGYAKRVGDDTHYPIAGVVAVDEAHDLALVKITGASAEPLRLGQAELVAVGDRVFTIGNPRGYEGTFSEGIVSAIRASGIARLLQVTTPIARGSSGGPVVNAQGDVIGITAALVEGEQNLNFALSVSYLRPLLDRLRPVAALDKIGLVTRYAGADASVGSPSPERVSEAIMTPGGRTLPTYLP